MIMREAIFLSILVLACGGAKDLKKKPVVGLKRAVETYAYTLPTPEDKSGEAKPKVIVETIKSISPSEYLSSSGSSFEASTPTGKVPLGSVTFSAFEPEATKESTAKPASTVTSFKTSPPPKKKSSYTLYIGSSAGGSSTQKLTAASTLQPAQARSSSVEPATTLIPNHQFASRSGDALDKSLKIIAMREKFGNGNGRYTVQKIVKKQAKLEPKLSDSKPEETGFNGYQYDVGLNFDSKLTGGIQGGLQGGLQSGLQGGIQGGIQGSGGGGGGGGGMMGASYMRSSSPFYNFHVMLD